MPQEKKEGGFVQRLRRALGVEEPKKSEDRPYTESERIAMERAVPGRFAGPRKETPPEEKPKAKRETPARILPPKAKRQSSGRGQRR